MVRQLDTTMIVASASSDRMNLVLKLLVFICVIVYWVGLARRDRCV